MTTLHVYCRLSLGVFWALCLSMICGRTRPLPREPYIFYEMPCLNGDKADRGAEPFCQTVVAASGQPRQCRISQTSGRLWWSLLATERFTVCFDFWNNTPTLSVHFQSNKARNAHKNDEMLKSVTSVRVIILQVYILTCFKTCINFESIYNNSY